MRNKDNRSSPASVGSGIVEKYKPIAIIPIAELVADLQAGSGADEEADDDGAQSKIRRDLGLLMRQAARRDPLNVLAAVAAKAPGVILGGKPKLSPISGGRLWLGQRREKSCPISHGHTMLAI
jgi:hypothetical protein